MEKLLAYRKGLLTSSLILILSIFFVNFSWWKQSFKLFYTLLLYKFPPSGLDTSSYPENKSDQFHSVGGGHH